MEPHFVGIEIGGTKLQVVVGNKQGRIQQRQRFAVNPADGRRGIIALLDPHLKSLAKEWKPRRVGVGFGGPVDRRTGTIERSHHVQGWTGFALGGWLRRTLGVPARVDNDANVAALGEAIRGAGKRFDPVFYVTLGSGVGGGLVVEGRIFHGARPGEAELGHVRLDRRGTILEDRCSGWAVDRRIRRAVRSKARTALRRLTAGTDHAESKFLLAALKQGDAVAKRILGETAEDLSFGLSHVTHLFHPEVIILGGGLSLVGEPLRRAVEKALPGFLMDAFRPGPAIRLARLAEDAVPVGALLLAAREPRLDSDHPAAAKVAGIDW